ncbi:MAG: 4'-phosphopantetheinyl transferase superfamily protein [Denitromonas halophila]|nr:MAG: 4'-phosphopantetheinyl transferase superfamily protein [Denitromonas halophila]TVT73285.1 MAG: 4'-phosphopantetheinyl transferase superfamily protein [Denitromonas halophila]
MTDRLRIFICTTDALSDRVDLLAPDEQQRARAIASSRRRRQFCAGRALLRLVLSQDGTQTPAAWRIRLLGDRPQLDGPDAPQFSLSHSGDHVGCAISQTLRCGFDLQAHAPRSRHGLANAFFADDDTRWLAEQSDFSAAFHQLWVLKESWAKVTGAPLLTALAQTRWQARHPANIAATPWDAGTTALTDTLTTGWTTEGTVATVELNEWHDGSFVPRQSHWTRWDLRIERDPARCDT